MIWDYQRRAVFTIVWQGRISFAKNQSIRAVGALTSHEVLKAHSIIEEDGTAHESPAFRSAVSDHVELFPVEGKVILSDFRDGWTYVQVYQTVPKLFTFSEFGDNRSFLTIPEFWNFLEERSKWEDDVVPRFDVLQGLKERRYEHPDIRDASWAVHRYGMLSGTMRQGIVPEILGHVIAKIEQLFRLRQKAEYGNRLKRHLLALSRSEGRSYLLDELVHEGPLLLEHAALIAYSVLDCLATLVNLTFQLGIPDQQTSFTTVLGREPGLEDGASLRLKFPEEHLTKFWLSAQAEWIADLRDFRHEIAHRGNAVPAYGPNERLLASLLNWPQDGMAQNYDVEQTIQGWLERAQSFFLKSLDHLANHCIEAVKPFEPNPVKPSVKPPKAKSDLGHAMHDILRLLFDIDHDPDRARNLFARFEKSWTRAWTLPRFKRFLAACESFSMMPNAPISQGFNGTSESASADVVVTAKGRALPWHLRLEKTKGLRPYLVRNSLTIPPYPKPETEVSGFHAKQSGPETGHKCAEFRFRLTAVGSQPLEDVKVCIFHYHWEVASVEAGHLAPGESKDLYAITTGEVGTFLPPGGPMMFVILTQEPVHARVLYRLETEMGSEWADDHVCVNQSGSI